MNKNHTWLIAKELNVPEKGVTAIISLLDEGATVPFISRYRKELTGSLDEVIVSAVKDQITKLRELDKRKEAVLKSIDEQGKLTDKLMVRVNQAKSMVELEDIYLPYKPKRKTRASIAKNKGLEPLANLLFKQGVENPYSEAKKYISSELGVEDAEEALQGARDIIAEKINENAAVRAVLRRLFSKKAIIRSEVIKGKEIEGQKFKDYFKWEEEIKKIPSHRLLAIRRGENEKILSVSILPDEEEALYQIQRKIIFKHNDCSGQVKIALKDAYKRLLKPSLENEIKASSKKAADEEAIKVFSTNLRQLLLSPALGQKATLAIDPGFRTGCKMVCLDKQGKLLQNDTIFPNEPQNRKIEAEELIMHYIKKYKPEAIAIGNGTASRETLDFVKSLEIPAEIIVTMVSENGASIYSASEVARDEFPDLDLTVRGAISIGRRMMDPLAELVKIDPKSIGVGQYQHDVDQVALKYELNNIVESCVNGVGVEINTASKQLLTHVSGLGPQLAENIVKFREENGPFASRTGLKKVPRMGAKAFEQAAGFMRIRGAKNILDSSAVHPESYKIVKQMADDLNCSVEDLVKDASLRSRIVLKDYVDGNIGLPTLKDIIAELHKPGRDPREEYEEFSFQDGVNKMGDLEVGMKLPGIITNITKFGAFVDIGVHQDGLVHISHLADSFVKEPSDIVKLQQQVFVTVLEVNMNLKRISLSMKSDPFNKNQKRTGNRREKR